LTANQNSRDTASPAASQAQPLADEGQKTKMDQDGNALPEGALLRLGSLRLRHRGTLRSIAFTRRAGTRRGVELPINPCPRSPYP
jgi:hypothetical protein